MKTLMFILMFFLASYAGIGDSLEVTRINLKNLYFQFLPCDINDPIIDLRHAELKRYEDDVIVIRHDGVTYYWRNKMVLFKGKNENMGCYKFVCIRWRDKFSFIYYEDL